ncbi:MAG: hypothetical protein HQL69_22125 [Magnetococcales bacterium]|nr:hypothetical protein [Magnetococcales bacterium]
MKKTFFPLLILLFVAFSVPKASIVRNVQADDRVSCDELAEVMMVIENFTDELERVDLDIEADSPFDRALKELLDGIYALADSEEDLALDNAAKRAHNAWEDMDKLAFERALRDIVSEIDGIGNEECNY